jgi:thiol:disulfide interchange protein DsbD
MKRSTALLLLLLALTITAGQVSAQGFGPEPVFSVKLSADREPLVAGDEAWLAVAISIESGWHINSDEPGDEFSVPTTLAWQLPEGWAEPEPSFPDGTKISFSFSETPIEVWEGKTMVLARCTVPADAQPGPVSLRVEVTAQACNDVQCLPPLPVKGTAKLEVAAAGTVASPVNQELFAGRPGTQAAASTDTGDEASRLASLSLPLLLLTVFFAGLALNLTPCIYPLIPITIGFFDQQAKERSGGTFGLAIAYVLGMAVTYSVLGVAAALAGKVFGFALGHPIVIGVIVFVVLALAASMFGLWELRAPAWAMNASGGRAGYVGALIMGLIVGFVAAPCIGPFVLGLVTFVGQRGDPVFGFIVFFTLAMGLGLPFLLLGTFTGMLHKLPKSGQWMIGIRKVFGVLLVALAVYFAQPLLAQAKDWLMPITLIGGGLYMLVIDRTGHDQPWIDRIMRLIAAGLIVVGAVMLPVNAQSSHSSHSEKLDWSAYDESAVETAVSSGGPVILDFYADWCGPCKELDVKTFSDPKVAAILSGYSRFKSDQTLTGAAEALAATKAHEVRGMPTVIVFKEGKERFRITGFEPPEVFIKRLQDLE